MENKILIINWRFTDDDLPITYSVNNDNDAKIIFSKYTEAENELKSFKLLVDRNLINNNKVLILTHTNWPNNISIDLLKTELNNNSEKLKIRGFEGGFGKVYYSNGKGIILADRDPDNGGSTLAYCLNHVLTDNIIIKANFDYVWNYYWNELDLEYQKKKIIDLFLPLFIDIKGLNDISNEENNPAYLNEVKAEYTKSYFDQLKKEWKEIKDILASEQGHEVLEEQFRLSEEEKELITSSPLENFTNIPSACKLSEWFPQVIDMLNKKIDQHKSHIA